MQPEKVRYMKASMNNYKIIVKAITLFPTITNSNYTFEFEGWSIKDHNPMIAIFEKEFEFNENNIDPICYEAVKKLEIILLSIFINDYIPKKIYQFEYSTDGLPLSIQIKLQHILGKSMLQDTIEQLALKSFSRSGFVHHKNFLDINYSIPEQNIKEWFDFLDTNSKIVNSLSLIQESYGKIFSLQNSQFRNYFDEFSFRAAIILLTSALEGLFLLNESNSQEIKFKFSTTGAIFYEKFVDKEYFQEFTMPMEKLSFTEFRETLRNLYNIRSGIAHGQEEILTKDMVKISKSMNVGISERHTKTQDQIEALLTLSLLQIHILGIIKLAKDNLLKGTDIIDEIFI